MTDQADIEDLDAVEGECRAAAETILASLEAILRHAGAMRLQSPETAAAIEAAALSGLEACAFQDIVGQRLARVRNGRSADPLLAGPQSAEASLSQASVDALFG